MNKVSKSMSNTHCCLGEANKLTFSSQNMAMGIERIEKIIAKELLCRHDIQAINQFCQETDLLERKIDQINDCHSQHILEKVKEKIKEIGCIDGGDPIRDAKHLISFFYLKTLSNHDLTIEDNFNILRARCQNNPETLKNIARHLPACHSKEQFAKDYKFLISARPNLEIMEILRQKQENAIKEKVEFKKLELNKERFSKRQEYPKYFHELLNDGYVHLCKHLIEMKKLKSRERRLLKIEEMTFSEISQIALEMREAIIHKVENSIPNNCQNILFLLGGSGSGKSTTLCYLRGDEMVLKSHKYESNNDENHLIGHDQAASCTFLPAIEIVHQWAIVDFPGFDDTNGPLISLGMECALKFLIKKYQPKILVIESITNIEGKFAAAAKLGLRLNRLLDNKEHCTLGITKYSIDSDYNSIVQIEEQQNRDRLKPYEDQKKNLVTGIQTLSSLPDSLQTEEVKSLIETNKQQLEKLQYEIILQAKQPLPDTPKKIDHRKKIEAREKELLNQIGLKNIVKFDSLENSRHSPECLSSLSENQAIYVNPEHQLDPDHKELLNKIFEFDLKKKLEKSGNNFNVGMMAIFEKRVKETSLIDTLLLLSHPEIGNFLHLGEIDSHIVRSYDGTVVDSCIDKYIDSIIDQLQVPPLSTLTENMGNKVPQEKIERLDETYLQLQKFVLGIKGKDLSTLQTNEQIQQQWNNYRMTMTYYDKTVEKEFALSPWVKVLMGLPLGIPLGIHALLQWKEKQRVTQKAVGGIIDDWQGILEKMQQALETLIELKALIKNKDIALTIVKNNGMRLKEVEASFKKNKEIVMAAVSRDGLALQYADVSLKNDKEIVIAAVSRNGETLQFVDQRLQSDEEVVLIAVKQNAKAALYADKLLMEKRSFAMRLVTQNVEAVKYIDEKFRKNKTFLLAAIARHPKALLFIDRKSDRDFISTAVLQNAMAYKVLLYATEAIRKDKDIILSAIKQNERAFQCADESLRKNKAFILAAIKQNDRVFQWVDASFKKDKEVVSAAMKPNQQGCSFVSHTPMEDKRVDLAMTIFGKDKWETYFGTVEDTPLPLDILQILASPCPFWGKGKTVQETHILVLIPATVNGVPLNLATLGELVKTPKQGYASDYRIFDIGKCQDECVQKSYWILMTKEIFEETRSFIYEDQCDLLNEHCGRLNLSYNTPLALEIAIGSFVTYASTGHCLYGGENPMIYTHCQCYDTNWLLFVGGYSAKEGLDVGHYHIDNITRNKSVIGMSAVRRF